MINIQIDEDDAKKFLDCWELLIDYLGPGGQDYNLDLFDAGWEIVSTIRAQLDE